MQVIWQTKSFLEMSKYNDKQERILVFLFYSIGQKIISFTDKWLNRFWQCNVYCCAKNTDLPSICLAYMWNLLDLAPGTHKTVWLICFSSRFTYHRFCFAFRFSLHFWRPNILFFSVNTSDPCVIKHPKNACVRKWMCWNKC